MKKLLTMAVVMALGLLLATPVLADHRGKCRRDYDRFEPRGYHSVYYAPHPRPRYRTSFFFGFGAPFFAPAPAYVYAPPPIVVEPGYYEPVWVPGHYVYDRGARIFITGYWSR